MKHNFKDLREKIKAKSSLSKYTYDKYQENILKKSITREKLQDKFNNDKMET